jgi:hypothetical protein
MNEGSFIVSKDHCINTQFPEFWLALIRDGSPPLGSNGLKRKKVLCRNSRPLTIACHMKKKVNIFMVKLLLRGSSCPFYLSSSCAFPLGPCAFQRYPC